MLRLPSPRVALRVAACPLLRVAAFGFDVLLRRARAACPEMFDSATAELNVRLALADATSGEIAEQRAA